MATTATTTITTTKTNPRGGPTSFSALPKENVYVGLLHVCERTAEATPWLEPLESDGIPHICSKTYTCDHMLAAMMPLH